VGHDGIPDFPQEGRPTSTAEKRIFPTKASLFPEREPRRRRRRGGPKPRAHRSWRRRIRPFYLGRRRVSLCPPSRPRQRRHPVSAGIGFGALFCRVLSLRTPGPRRPCMFPHRARPAHKASENGPSWLVGGSLVGGQGWKAGDWIPLVQTGRPPGDCGTGRCSRADPGKTVGGLGVATPARSLVPRIPPGSTRTVDGAILNRTSSHLQEGVPIP